MKNMKSLSLSAALSLCCAPSAFAGSDQALGLAYQAASIVLAAGGGEAEVPPAQAKPVQPTLSALEQKALALQLKVLTDETRVVAIRRAALKNIDSFPPGPHDKQILSALTQIVDGIPRSDTQFEGREFLSSTAIDRLAGIAIKSDAGVTRAVIETMGRVLTRKNAFYGGGDVHKDAISQLIKIAKARLETADLALTHLLKAVDYKIDEKLKIKALEAHAEISQSLTKQQAADPVPGPVRLERIP